MTDGCATEGSIAVEYALVLAFAVVFIVGVFRPTPDNGFYDLVRSAYRRAVVVIGLPLL